MLIDRISSHFQILQLAHSLLHRGSGDESGGNIGEELCKISIVPLMRVNPILFPYSCGSFICNARQGKQHLKIVRQVCNIVCFQVQPDGGFPSWQGVTFSCKEEWYGEFDVVHARTGLLYLCHIWWVYGWWRWRSGLVSWLCRDI